MREPANNRRGRLGLRSVWGRSSFGVALGVAFVLTTVVAPFPAQADGEDSEFTNEARNHYETGQSLYREGHYEEAARELRQAYALTPKPLLLYNIMLAQWRSGELEQATSTALLARETSLPPSLRVKTKARIPAFHALAASRRLANRLREEEYTESGDRAVETTEATGGADGPRAGRSNAGWWLGGITLGLGGVGLAGAAVIDGMVARNTRRTRTALGRGNRAEARRLLEQEVEPKQRLGQAVLYSGAALTASGLAVLAVQWLSGPSSSSNSSSERATVEVGPRFTEGRAGVFLRGSF